ncbi:hypothetical protein AOT14_28450 [Stenotrophomonas acidaminiphila]|uniref:Uncharacterized protein n=1 Tax=Stenotrophomonas acidaminiphila TaxID=128780 RepID=A0A0S1B2B8_9GAMM|nr:hypothetical protein AOT14_28450 [Stenotrophomonas acidaminiphila]
MRGTGRTAQRGRSACLRAGCCRGFCWRACSCCCACAVGSPVVERAVPYCGGAQAHVSARSEIRAGPLFRERAGNRRAQADGSRAAMPAAPSGGWKERFPGLLFVAPPKKSDARLRSRHARGWLHCCGTGPGRPKAGGQPQLPGAVRPSACVLAGIRPMKSPAAWHGRAWIPMRVGANAVSPAPQTPGGSGCRPRRRCTAPRPRCGCRHRGGKSPPAPSSRWRRCRPSSPRPAACR